MSNVAIVEIRRILFPQAHALKRKFLRQLLCLTTRVGVFFPDADLFFLASIHDGNNC